MPNYLPGHGWLRIGANTQVDATSGSIDSIDQFGVVTGTVQPPGAQMMLVLDDEYRYNSPVVTSDNSGNFVATVPTPQGGHHINGRLMPSFTSIGTTNFYRTDTQQPYVPAGRAAPGIAAGYTNDVNLASDPACIWYVDFSDTTWPVDFFNIPTNGTGYTGGFTIDTEPISGLPRYNQQYNIGDFAPFTRVNDYDPLDPFGTNQGGRYLPDALYYRYYIRFKKGYQCDVQGKKIPGLDYRTGGGLDPGGDGNGGNWTTGKMEVNGLSGGSMRCVAAPSAATGQGVLFPHSYLYWADMDHATGQPYYWNVAGLLEDYDYCIEQYVKMNSIDLSILDGSGNGVGRYDGIIRQWVNDVLVLEITNLRWRHHPKLHIHGPWMDHFHGGTVAAEAVHPFSQWGMCVATSRIGMINTPTPVATTNLANNSVYAVNPCPAENCSWSGGRGGQDTFKNYSKGVWNPDARQFIMVAGGESNVGPAWACSKDTGLWSVGSQITTQGGFYSSQHLNSQFDTTWAWFSDGVAAIGHTYDTPVWVPAAWGITGAKGGFGLMTRKVVSADYTTTNRPVICDSNTLVWSKAAANDSSGDTRCGNNGGGDSTCIDIRNRRYLTLSGATSRTQNSYISTTTFADSSGIGVQGQGPTLPGGAQFVPRYPRQTPVNARRKVIIAGGKDDFTLELQWYDMDTLDAIHEISYTGSPDYCGAGVGITYCEWADCFIMLPATSGDADPLVANVANLYRVTPDWTFNTPWTISYMPITGATGYSAFNAQVGFGIFADPVDQTVNWPSAQAYYGTAFFKIRIPV